MNEGRIVKVISDGEPKEYSIAQISLLNTMFHKFCIENGYVSEGDILYNDDTETFEAINGGTLLKKDS